MRSCLLMRAVVRYGFSLVLCCGAFSVGYAQVDADYYAEWRPASAPNSPLLVAVLDTPVDSSWLARLHRHQEQRDYSLMILSDTDTLANICTRINGILNEESINKRRVYLLGALPEDQRHKYRLLNLDIIADAQWIESDPIPTEAELDAMWLRFCRKALWTYDVESIQRKTKVVERSDRVEGGVGLSLMTAGTNFQSTGLGIPSGMQFWSYNAYRRVYPRWFFDWSIEVGLNRPDPQQVLFDQIIGQIDVFSILSGDEVEVELDTEVTGYIGGSMGAGLSYLLTQNKRATPYLGLDLRFFAANFIHVDIDTTFIIDGTNGIVGGSPNNVEFDRDSEDVTSTSFYYLTLCPKLGLYLDVGERLLLDLNASYQPDPASWRGEEEHFSLLRFSMGLRYRLLGKRSSHYEYLRISARP
ncbi:MAG: hypothetical protein AAFN81_15435 [Bacteroidota bacterium]